jgi:hypothetical protein
MSVYENNDTATANATSPAGGSAINDPAANPLLYSSSPLVTDLEQEVLDEYARLLKNVNMVCCVSSSYILIKSYISTTKVKMVAIYCPRRSRWFPSLAHARWLASARTQNSHRLYSPQSKRL